MGPGEEESLAGNSLHHFRKRVSAGVTVERCERLRRASGLESDIDVVKAKSSFEIVDGQSQVTEHAR